MIHGVVMFDTFAKQYLHSVNLRKENDLAPSDRAIIYQSLLQSHEDGDSKLEK